MTTEGAIFFFSLFDDVTTERLGNFTKFFQESGRECNKQYYKGRKVKFTILLAPGESYYYCTCHQIKSHKW